MKHYSIKAKLFFLTVLFFSLFGLAKNTWAATLNAINCSLSEVQAKVDSAVRGDTIRIPTGTCTWSGELSVTKALTLQGAGAGATIINGRTMVQYCGSATPCEVEASLIKYEPTTADATLLFRVTGFTFDLKSSVSGINLWSTLANEFHQNRIDNNIFINCPPLYQGLPYYDWFFTIKHHGAFYGVIDNNTFSGVPQFMFTGSCGFAQKSLSYDYGADDDDTMFFEDNAVTYNVPSVGPIGNGLTISCAGHDTVRYNTFTLTSSINNTNFWGVLNVHGNNLGTYGAFGSELYGNLIKPEQGASGGGPLLIRGGQNMVFFNRVESSYSLWNRVVEQYEGRWPNPLNSSTIFSQCPASTLYGTIYGCDKNGNPQHVNKTYLFNNREGISGGAGTVSSIANQFDYHVATTSSGVVTYSKQLREGTDFWKDNSSCASGGSCNVTGVGCGSTLPTTCRSGSGFWLTSQNNCGNIEAYTGKRGTGKVNISGTFYRCGTNSTWSAYYVPYTYPHPLRSGTENTAPAAPAGVRVI